MRLSRSFMPLPWRLLNEQSGIWKAAIKELTWRRVMTAEAIGLLINFLRSLDGWGSTQHVVVRTVFTTGAAFLLVVAALVAAEAVRRGAAPLRAYGVALLSAAGAAAGVQFTLRRQLGIHPVHGDMAPLVVKEWLWVCSDVQTVVLLGGIGLLAFYNRRSVERILRNVRLAELTRVRLERALVESRLAAAQTQVDPRALFDALAQIRNLYASSSPEADRALENLILTLRARRSAPNALAASARSEP